MFLSLEAAYGLVRSPKYELTAQMVTEVVSTAMVVLWIFNCRT